MKHVLLPLSLLAGSLAPLPVAAQNDLGEVVGSVAREILNRELDTRSFAQAQGQNTIQAYQNYLQSFPQGQYRAEAERAIARLAPQVQQPPTVRPDGTVAGSPAAVEAALGLSRAQRTAVQRNLTGLGYNTGGTDGVWGNNTRRALRNWQSDNGLQVTGYVTAAQLERIMAQTGGIDRVPPSNNTGTGSTEATERALGLSVSERREVQLRLTLLRHDTGGTEGSFGSGTRSAIRAWQRSQGEAQTGYLNADQLRALQRQTGG